MKVLHTITNLETGGAEVMLYRLLQAGARDKFRPSVISLMNPDPGDGGTIAPRIAALRIQVSNLGMQRRLPSPAHLWRLRQTARAIDPDLLQGWMYHGNLAATVASRSLDRRPPVIWNVRHSLHDLALEKPLTRTVVRACIPLSHLPRAIIYNARVSAAQHERLGYAADRSIVIPNGFDGEQFKPRPDGRRQLCEELGIGPDAVIIGMIARDHPMKDAANLVRAVAALHQAGRPVQLVIAGRGQDAANRSLAKEIRGAGLGPHITLLGERQDVPAIVAGFDIAALPSAWGEGFPNVLGEAMASGIPCVATDVGDSAWVIGPHGIVVPPRQADALAAALARLIDLGADGRRQLGAAARARILEKFSIQEVVRQYEALHERVGERSVRREPLRVDDLEVSRIRAAIREAKLAGDRRHG